MEKQTKNLFYIGTENVEEKQRRSTKPDHRMSGRIIDRIKPKERVLDVYRLARPLSYAQGNLQIYFCLLPYSFFEKEKKEPDAKAGKKRTCAETGKKSRSTKRRKKKWVAAIGRAMTVAKNSLQGGGFDYVVVAEQVRREFVLQSGFAGNGFTEDLPEKLFTENELSEGLLAENELPEELFAVCLWEAKKNRSNDSISISLPQDCGRLAVEQVITLMEPYLSRINSAVFVGEESEAANLLEDYLYDEYGIPASYDKYPLKNTIWVDLSEKENLILKKYAKENEIYHINKKEVMKFLDTTAKNGYNTKVN